MIIIKYEKKYDNNIIFGNKFISLNTTNLHSSLDSLANITINNVDKIISIR